MNNITGAPVTGSNFYPRQGQLAHIWRRLPHSSLLLAAPRRSGKTSILFHIRDNAQFDYVPLFFNVEGDYHPAAFIAHLVDRLRRAKGLPALGKYLGSLFDALLPEKLKVTVGSDLVKVELEKAFRATWDEQGQRVLDALRQIPEGQSVVFLVDEFPLLLQKMHRAPDLGKPVVAQFLHWFRSLRNDPELVQGKVRFVLTGSIGVEGILRRLHLSASLNDLDRITLEPFSRDQALGLLRMLHASDAGGEQSRDAQERDTETLDPVFNTMLDRIEELSPYYVQLFYKEARELADDCSTPLDQALVQRTYEERMLGAAGRRALSHYQERLDDALPEKEASLARFVLDLAAEREQGISEARVYDQIDTETGMSPDAVDPIIQILLHDGYLKRDKRRLRFRARLLRDWWRNERSAVRHAAKRKRRTGRFKP